MDPGSVRHAFLSYVREDTAKVDRLEQFLTEAGLRVWRDKSDLMPGEDWKLKIREAIVKDSLAFIACFSQHLAAREVSYQYEELLLAVEHYRQRPPDRPWLFPVRFTDCELPHLDLGGNKTLDSLQRVDLLGDEAAWDSGLTKLLRSIQRTFPDLGHQRAPELRAQAPQPHPILRRPTVTTRTAAKPPTAVQGHSLD